LKHFVLRTLSAIAIFYFAIALYGAFREGHWITMVIDFVVIGFLVKLFPSEKKEY